MHDEHLDCISRASGPDVAADVEAEWRWEQMVDESEGGWDGIPSGALLLQAEGRGQ